MTSDILKKTIAFVTSVLLLQSFGLAAFMKAPHIRAQHTASTASMDFWHSNRWPCGSSAWDSEVSSRWWDDGNGNALSSSTTPTYGKPIR